MSSYLTNLITFTTTKTTAELANLGSEACLAMAVHKGAAGAVQLVQGNRPEATKNLGLAAIAFTAKFLLDFGKTVSLLVAEAAKDDSEDANEENVPSTTLLSRYQTPLRALYISLILAHNAPRPAGR